MSYKQLINPVLFRGLTQRIEERPRKCQMRPIEPYKVSKETIPRS
jgi:hypothetical protein